MYYTCIVTWLCKISVVTFLSHLPIYKRHINLGLVNCSTTSTLTSSALYFDNNPSSSNSIKTSFKVLLESEIRGIYSYYKNYNGSDRLSTLKWATVKQHHTDNHSTWLICKFDSANAYKKRVHMYRQAVQNCRLLGFTQCKVITLSQHYHCCVTEKAFF